MIWIKVKVCCHSVWLTPTCPLFCPYTLDHIDGTETLLTNFIFSKLSVSYYHLVISVWSLWVRSGHVTGEEKETAWKGKLLPCHCFLWAWICSHSPFRIPITINGNSSENSCKIGPSINLTSLLVNIVLLLAMKETEKWYISMVLFQWWEIVGQSENRDVRSARVDTENSLLVFWPS